MLYNIIKQLQDTPSTNDKLAILKANKDNELLKEYMRLVCCPSVNFYITAKTLPKVEKVGECVVETTFWFDEVVMKIANRVVTGNEAKAFIKKNMEMLCAEWQELFKMLLLKDIRAKVGATLVNKVWPNLCISVPYQRCSLPDEKNLKKFKEAETFIVQTKGDGMFASLVIDSLSNEKVKLFTRNGNKFPAWFAEYLAIGLDDDKHVYEGELICFRNGEMLSRKEGNGILNSVMQEGELPVDVSVRYYVWNRVDTFSWKNGKESNVYIDLFNSLVDTVRLCNPKNIDLIDYKIVHTLEEAYAFNNEQLAKGLEGSIIKTLTHKWRDGTSKECLKLKLTVDIDLIWWDSVEGEGKASAMLGAMRLKSSCGGLMVDCGTGFSDALRKKLWEEREALHGSVVSVTANDVLTKEGSNTLSLFLPVFQEVRTDKTQADDVERIHAMFSAAKNM